MTKIHFNSDMFYAGFPVFIGLTKVAETGEVRATTYSSSYMLNDTLVVGVGSDGQTASQLTVGSKLSVNYLSADDGVLADIGGLVSRRTKLSALTGAGAELTEVDGVPVLENGLLTVIGTVEQVVEIGEVKHLFVKISDRLISEQLVKSDKIDWEKFNNLEYVGAQKDRFYKTVSPELKKKGQYLKESRQK